MHGPSVGGTDLTGADHAAPPRSLVTPARTRPDGRVVGRPCRNAAIVEALPCLKTQSQP